MRKNKLMTFMATAFLATMPMLAFAAKGGGGLMGIEPFAGTSGSNLVDAVRFIINGLLILTALIASIYLIIGGIQYIVSQGDEDKAGKAKNTILFAIIGLIVIGLSAAIVNFVVNAIQNS